jgi:hypothetical protein
MTLPLEQQKTTNLFRSPAATSAIGGQIMHRAPNATTYPNNRQNLTGLANR